MGQFLWRVRLKCLEVLVEGRRCGGGRIFGVSGARLRGVLRAGV
jgi:hypothetical protein